MIMSGTTTAGTEEETAWTDACIRWDENHEDPHRRPPQLQGDDDADEEEDERPFDPFADPDPTQEFQLDYRIPDDGNGSGTQQVSIVIRGYKADSDQTWQSTGLTLWKASHHLNAYILQHYNQWRGARILELGAGLGVCGILLDRLLTSTAPAAAAATTSRTFVCLTDGDTKALPMLRENCRVNGANPDKDAPVQTTCRQLLWGHDTAQKFLDQMSTQQAGVTKFNVIVASDIIYAPQILVPLWETIQLLLSKEDGVFVLAFCRRKVPVQVADVLKTATEFGLEYHRIRSMQDPATVKDEDDKTSDEVFLYEFQWAKRDDCKQR